MFRRIFVPLDGSSRAERALPVALTLAKANHGVITLFQVLHETRPLGTLAATSSIDTRPMDEFTAQAYLSQIAARPDFEGVKSQTFVQAGPPAPIILDAIADERTDLVVICRHGQSALTRWTLGSVAEKVARHSPAPTLLIHESGPTLFGVHVDHMPSALVPLDDSALSQRAIEPAAQLICALAQQSDAALHLLHVIGSAREDVQFGAADTLTSAGGRALRDAFLQHADTLRQPGLSVNWSVMQQRDVARSILDVAEGRTVEDASATPKSESEKRAPFDLIAMTSYGEGGLQRWGLGSVSERVLHGTRLPMLIVRPEAA